MFAPLPQNKELFDEQNSAYNLGGAQNEPRHRPTDSENTQTQVKRISSGHMTRCDSKNEIENNVFYQGLLNPGGINSNSKLNGKLQLISNQRYAQANMPDSGRQSQTICEGMTDKNRPVDGFFG